MKMILAIILVLFLVFYWLFAQSDRHLNRNKHNQLPKGRLKHLQDNYYEDEVGLIWELQPQIKNKFHQPDHEVEIINNHYPNVDGTFSLDPKNPNFKFLSKNNNRGSFEAILQPDGTYLTEGLKQGTYNYGHPDGLWGSIKHVFLDVIPHFFNSNYKS